jgi:hypothetical protein
MTSAQNGHFLISPVSSELFSSTAWSDERTRAIIKPKGPSKNPKAKPPQPLRPLFYMTSMAATPNSNQNIRRISMRPLVCCLEEWQESPDKFKGLGW